MQQVKRFYYVTSLDSKTMHRQYGKHHSEGLTACKRAVSKGWFWYHPTRADGGSNKLPKPLCKRCEAAR